MPTGYTADVVDGKVTEFKDFAMQCARAFGALIMMRDDPLNAPIPDEFAPDTRYYDERIAAELKRLGEVQAMTDAEAEQAAKDAHQKALDSRADYLARKDAEASRLNTMLAKVRAWTPPSPDHEEMKRFMVEQITVSMPGSYAPEIPVLLDGATWRKQESDRLAKSIAYDKNERAKEIERATGRSAWLKQLRASLAA